MVTGGAGKRGVPEGDIDGNDGVKKSKREMESFTSGIGSKPKPCRLFFSSSGCSFGEGCHFLHFVPGGVNVASQILGYNPSLPPSHQVVTPPVQGPSPLFKTRLCNKHGTTEGCKFGDRCRFVHGELELNKSLALLHDNPHAGGRFGGNYMQATPSNFGVTTGFGASTSAKISIDKSLVGAVLGVGRVKLTYINQMTGAELCIMNHEKDPNLKNIELKGTFEQIKQATKMIQEVLERTVSSDRYYKTKLCYYYFSNGSCPFGEKCHFAHGNKELRKTES